VSELGSWADELRAGKVERQPGALPPHYPSCFGCGPEAEAGLHLVTRLEGDLLKASYTFATRHAGAPGIAHGGLVAAVVDDVCGFSLFVIKKPAVTRKLEIEYLKPVLVGVPYDIVAKVERSEGRKVFVSCEGTSPEGVLTFRGDALFVIVDLSHFAQGNQPSEGQPPTAL
jgi:acyl-coenzyme A thioesterase PaaI-like protein